MIVETESRQNMKVMEIDADCEVIPQFSLDPTVYPSVTHLDLSFNRITCLSGLAAYVNLETVILDNNCLTDDLQLPFMKYLHVLSLNKNYITDLERCLRSLQMAAPKLVYLSLLNNPVCPTEMENSSYTAADYRRYRIRVIRALPTLRFLDSQAVTRRELNEATGKNAPGPLDLETIEELFPTQTFTRKRVEPTVSIRYARVKSTYHGKHSEGNRFIRNNDL